MDRSSGRPRRAGAPFRAWRGCAAAGMEAVEQYSRAYFRARTWSSSAGSSHSRSPAAL